MPGPKHPAKRLYELSEKIRRFHKIIDKIHGPILIGRQKNERRKQKEEYDYEVIQFEYFNRRIISFR